MRIKSAVGIKTILGLAVILSGCSKPTKTSEIAPNPDLVAYQNYVSNKCSGVEKFADEDRAGLYLPGIRYDELDFYVEKKAPSLSQLIETDILQSFGQDLEGQPESPLFWNTFAVGSDLIDPQWVSGPTKKQNILGVLDSGFDLENPALKGRIQKYFGPEKFFNPSTPMHGTHVIGTIASSTDFSVSPLGKFVLGLGSYTYELHDGTGVSPGFGDRLIYQNILTERIKKLLSLDGNLRAITASLKFGENAGYVAALNRLLEKTDAVYISAAGNDFSVIAKSHENKVDPKRVIFVASIGRERAASDFSNFFSGNFISAPGEEILSLAHKSAELNELKEVQDFKLASGEIVKIHAISGTSMATPHVSGVYTLLADINPALTRELLLQIISETAIDMGAKGRDIFYGYGILNALGAARLADILKDKQKGEALNQMSQEAAEFYVKAKNETDFQKKLKNLRVAYHLDPKNILYKKAMYVLLKKAGWRDHLLGLGLELVSQTGDRGYWDAVTSLSEEEKRLYVRFQRSLESHGIESAFSGKDLKERVQKLLSLSAQKGIPFSSVFIEKLDSKSLPILMNMVLELKDLREKHILLGWLYGKTVLFNWILPSEGTFVLTPELMDAYNRLSNGDDYSSLFGQYIFTKLFPRKFTFDANKVKTKLFAVEAVYRRLAMAMAKEMNDNEVAHVYMRHYLCDRVANDTVARDLNTVGISWLLTSEEFKPYLSLLRGHWLALSDSEQAYALESDLVPSMVLYAYARVARVGSKVYQGLFSEKEYLRISYKALYERILRIHDPNYESDSDKALKAARELVETLDDQLKAPATTASEMVAKWDFFKKLYPIIRNGELSQDRVLGLFKTLLAENRKLFETRPLEEVVMAISDPPQEVLTEIIHLIPFQEREMLVRQSLVVYEKHKAAKVGSAEEERLTWTWHSLEMKLVSKLMDNSTLSSLKTNEVLSYWSLKVEVVGILRDALSIADSAVDLALRYPELYKDIIKILEQGYLKNANKKSAEEYWDIYILSPLASAILALDLESGLKHMSIKAVHRLKKSEQLSAMLYAMTAIRNFQYIDPYMSSFNQIRELVIRDLADQHSSSPRLHALKVFNDLILSEDERLLLSKIAIKEFAAYDYKKNGEDIIRQIYSSIIQYSGPETLGELQKLNSAGWPLKKKYLLEGLIIEFSGNPS